jgi:HAD superfamily hydrolase (TIGR01484 family)
VRTPFFADVRAVFTDLDGTLTIGGRLAASTWASCERLERAGIPVILVTGRPAGWAHALARTGPFAAAVAENGGVIFAPHPDRPGLRKIFAVPSRRLPDLRRRMRRAAVDVARQVRGARLAGDTPYTEVNLAIDWNEDARLPESAARRIEAILRARGFQAVRSSVHVNYWPGRFDKLTACRRVVRDVLGGDPADLAPYIYVGDALNDEPLFRGFPRSVGVANVRAVWDDLVHRPARVTRAAEGRGFEEVARAVLRARRA